MINCHNTCFIIMLLVGAALVAADVLVLEKSDLEKNDTSKVVVSIPEEANFGRQHVVLGRLENVDPRLACNFSVGPPPYDMEQDWIALIGPGHCVRELKVLGVQHAGFNAAILYNSPGHNSTVLLDDDNVDFNATRIEIPAVSVDYSNGTELAHRYSYKNEKVLIKIEGSPGLPNDIQEGDGLVIANISMLVLLLVSIAIVSVCFKVVNHDWLFYPVRKMVTIPETKFKKGDQFDMCVICLEEFKHSENVCVLPCHHTYHSQCIAPWLVRCRGTCPQCNHVVRLGRTNSSNETRGSRQPPQIQEESSAVTEEQVADLAMHTDAADRFTASDQDSARVDPEGESRQPPQIPEESSADTEEQTADLARLTDAADRSTASDQDSARVDPEGESRQPHQIPQESSADTEEQTADLARLADAADRSTASDQDSARVDPEVLEVVDEHVSLSAASPAVISFDATALSVHIIRPTTFTSASIVDNLASDV